MRQAVGDQPLGDDDREDDNGDNAARIEEDLPGGEELGVERQEHACRRHERQCQPQHGVEQVPAEHDGQPRANEHGSEAPESGNVERHASPAAAGFSATVFLGGACMSRSRLPVAQDASCWRPITCRRSLSSSISRRSAVDMSNDFIMMMASVGQTWTHSSQNSQAYSSSVKVFAKLRFSALSISTLITWGGQMYSQSRQPMQFSSPVSLS